MSLVVTIQNATPKGTTALCETCSWAHIQHGFAESEQLVQCNYGWDFLREVPFPVRTCTNYNNRTLPDMATMEKLAWKLEFRKSAHPLGFSSGSAPVTPEEDES